MQLFGMMRSWELTFDVIEIPADLKDEAAEYRADLLKRLLLMMRTSREIHGR